MKRRKQCLAWALCAGLLAGQGVPALAASYPAEGYAVVQAEYKGKELDFYEEDRLVLRFADTKEVIPTSYYEGGGRVYALVPEEDKDRPVEPYLPEWERFADETDAQYSMASPYLASRGIVQGSTGRQVEYSRPVTQAEALAMVMRLLDTPAAQPGQDWYAPYVEQAREMGILSGVLEPNEPATKEQYTVWSVAVMEHLSWLTPAPADQVDTLIEETYSDASAISAQGRQAYAALLYHNLLTIDSIEGGDGDARLSKPQDTVTREIAMEYLWILARRVPAYPTELAEQYGFAEQMPVIDGSTSTLPITESIYSALFTNGTQHPQYPNGHSKTQASYEPLIRGEADCLVVSVPPSQIVLEMAEQAGVELEVTPIGYDAMVFFTNSENPASNLTTEQIRQIYEENAYQDWSQLGGGQAALVPFCRNESSGSQALMRQFILGDAPVDPAIRQETIAVAMADILTDVAAVPQEQAGAYGLGYSVYYYFLGSSQILVGEDALKLLSINGVAPSAESFRDGSYPLAGNVYVVLRADAAQDGPGRRMRELLLSPAGQQIVQNSGYEPLEQPKQN